MTFRLDAALADRLRRFLIGVWVLLALFGVLSLVLIHTFDTDRAREVGRFLSLGLEQTPGTWVASTLLLSCALLAVVGALEAKESEPQWARGWWLLAVVLAILSFDEVADFHGQFSPRISGVLGDTSGFLTFAWIVPAFALGLVFLIVEAPLLRHLGSTGRILFLAGVVFVAGAVGLEMIEGDLADQGDQETLAYDVLVVAEELMEFGAVMWALMTLVGYLRCRLDSPRVGVLDEVRPAQPDRFDLETTSPQTPR